MFYRVWYNFSNRENTMPDVQNSNQTNVLQLKQTC